MGVVLGSLNPDGTEAPTLIIRTKQFGGGETGVQGDVLYLSNLTYVGPRKTDCEPKVSFFDRNGSEVSKRKRKGSVYGDLYEYCAEIPVFS